MKLLMLELRDNVILYINVGEIVYINKEDGDFTVYLSNGLSLDVPAFSDGERAIQRLIIEAKVV